MSPTLTPAPQKLLEGVEGTYVNINLTRYTCAIGITILCYDAVLTFGDEVRLMWCSQWCSTKFLHYLNRIITFFSLLLHTWHLAGFRSDLSSQMCEGILDTLGELDRCPYREYIDLFFAFTAYTAILSFCIANWMILLRVSAVYGNDRTVFWGLTTFWILSYISTVTLMSLAVKELHGKIHYSMIFNVCVIPQIPVTLPLVWISAIAFEITTFTMSIYKTWKHVRENGDLSSNPLLRVLCRDSILYFVVIMAMRLFNLICWLMFPVSLMFVGVFILWALITVMINRLFLNLRSLHNSERTDWGREAEEDPWSTHTPAAIPNQAQSANIFGGGTMIYDKEINPRRRIGITGIHVTRTEERQSRRLDNLWHINTARMSAKAHALTLFLPQDAPLKQTQVQVKRTSATLLTYKAQGLSPYVHSPQMTAFGYNSQPPLQRHGSSSRVLVPRQNSDNWDGTWPREESGRGK